MLSSPTAQWRNIFLKEYLSFCLYLFFKNISWKHKGIEIRIIAPSETNWTHSTLIPTNNFKISLIWDNISNFHNFLWWYRLIFLCYLMKKWSNRWDLTILKRWKMTRGKLWVSDASFVNANSTILMPKVPSISFSPDFILILSSFYPVFIQTLLRFYPNFIRMFEKIRIKFG